MTEFLKMLGFYYGVLQTTTFFYLYKGIEFAVVKVPGWGYYFEAEIVATNQDSIKKANKKIMSVCQEFNLNVLNDKDFCKLLESLNDRSGFRFNFKKQNFSEIKKRFVDYF